MKKKYLGKCCEFIHHSTFKMLVTLKLTAFLVLFSAIAALAQQVSVSGKITDSSGQPLPGVTVVILGTTQGTVSNIDGNFTLPNVPSNANLRASFIGMVTQEVAVNGRTTINLRLEQDAIGLDEVIAIGYGTQRKRDLTSAITVVSASDMAKAPVADVGMALQGIAPGISVTNTRSGEPDVTIRGLGSTSGATRPLYVIDGVPQEGSYVNTADIETMQVLKDAASTAIYGSRGANGVIIITTKKGKSERAGEPRVSLNSYYGVEKAWKQLDMLNTEQWAQLVYDAAMATNGATPPSALAKYIVEDQKGRYTAPDNNWQDAIFQTGMITENILNVSGGTDAGNYFFSAGQYYQDGIIIATPFKRYSVRMNSSWRKGNFSFGENISFNYQERRNEPTVDGRAANQVALKLTPNIPVYDPSTPDGYAAGADYRHKDYPYAPGHDGYNPVAYLNRTKNMNYNRRFMANAYGEYKIMDGLTFRSTFGLTSVEMDSRNLALKTPSQGRMTNTTLTENNRWTYNWTWEQMLTWTKKFGDHDFNVMGAYTSDFFKMHNASATGWGIQTDANNVLGMTESNYSVDGGEREESRISYLGRVMYNYKGKYMLTANIRRDGSSKFGAGNKWGTFPSASAAWRVNDEPFMDNFNASTKLSNQKLRASYGVVGNDGPINAYSYLSGLSQQYYNNGSVALTGVTVTSFNNANIKWETSEMLDLGIDLGFLRDALTFEVDWYNKKTKDMLVGIVPPGSSGSTTSINQNVGSILNRGWEISSTYRKNSGDFGYSLTANFATNYNEVLDLYGTVITAGGTEYGNVTRTEKGHAIGSFYGYKTNGLWQANEETEAAKFGAKPGDVKFVDLNGDGRITTAGDYTYIGDPAPKFTYGLNASINYKNFDFSIFFQGVQGNDIFAAIMIWTEGMQHTWGASTDALNRWTPSNTNTNVPRAIVGDPNGNISNISDRYIKDGSYLRIKNATLGYTLPKAWTDYVKLSNVRVYTTGRNLLTFTNYPYYDPEIGSGATGVGATSTTSTARGIDPGYYPQARTIIMGIQIDF